MEVESQEVARTTKYVISELYKYFTRKGHACCFTFQVGGGVTDLDPKARERVIISKGGVLTDLHMHD